MLQKVLTFANYSVAVLVETIMHFFSNCAKNYACTIHQGLAKPRTQALSGRDPFEQNFQNFPSRIKWNSLFRNVHFGNFAQPLEVDHFFRNVGTTGNLGIFCSI